MAYDDDELFEDDFDFVDDDDSQIDAEQPATEPDAEGESRQKKSPLPKNKRSGSPEKKKSKPTNRRAKKEEPPELAEEGAEADEQPDDGDDAQKQPAEPEGPPADHVVHVYEFGQFKRTIARKFTDVEAVSFSEEYSRTGKPYGRLAIPAQEDDPPAESFADVAKS